MRPCGILAVHGALMIATSRHFLYRFSTLAAAFFLISAAFTLKAQNHTPSVDGGSPSAGRGITQTFTFQFSDPDTASDLGVLNILVNNFLDGRHACSIAYAHQIGVLYLVNDAGTAITGMLMNGTGSVSNSQCTIDGAGSSVQTSYNTLTLQVSVTFSPTFAGDKVIYAAARDRVEANSGWKTLGVYNVPGTTLRFPTISTISPASGGSSRGDFTITYVDETANGNLQGMQFLVNKDLDGRHACYVAYDRPNNYLYLINDAGTALLPPIVPGQKIGSAENSQCILRSASTEESGQLLKLTLSLDFKEAFYGPKTIYAGVQTRTGANSDWHAVGAWTVPGEYFSLVQTNVSSGGAVPTNAKIRVRFNRPVKASTINAAAFNLGVTGTVALNATRTIATLIPSSPLAANRGYSGWMSSAIQDDAGNNLTNSYFYFTTGAGPENTPLVLTSASPLNGDYSVASSARLAIGFNRQPDLLSMMDSLQLTGPQGAINGTFALPYGNSTVALFTPNRPLPAGLYTVSLGSNTTDVAGNSLTAPVTYVFAVDKPVDTEYPRASFSIPAGSPTVPPNARLIVQFNERVEPGELTMRLDLPSGGSVPATVAIDPLRLSAELTPSVALAANTNYYLYANAADVSGNSSSWSTAFKVSGVTDVTGPTVVAATPPNGTTSVPRNAIIRIQLSEPIAPLSVSATSIQLTPAVPGTVALADTQTVTFSRTALLAASTTYSLTVSGLRDAAGNLMTPYVGTFTTSDSSSASGPTVTAVTPAAGAVDVPVSTPIQLTFSAPVDPATVISTFIYARTPRGVAATTLSQPAPNQVTLTPVTPWPAATEITVNVTGSVRDLAGNSATSFSSKFTTANTADTTPLQIVSITPANGATAVNPSLGNVIVTFNKSVDTALSPGTVAVLVGGEIVSSGSLYYSGDGRTITRPLYGLNENTTYTIAVSGVGDLSGNVLPLAQSSFTTGAGSSGSFYPRTVRPGSGSGPVPVSSSISFFMSEAVKPETVSASSVNVLQGGVPVAGTVTLQASNRVIVFTPSVPFAPGANVSYSLSGTLESVSGRQLQYSYSGNFTTAGSGLTVTTVSPSDTAPLNCVFDIRFSRPLDPATASASNIVLYGPSSSVVPSGRSLLDGGRVYRIIPATNLSSSTSYRIKVAAAVRDIYGSTLGTDQWIYRSTGTEVDSTTGTIAGVIPYNGATEVGVNAPVLVRFSKAVDVALVSSDNVRLVQGSTTIPATFMLSENVITVTPVAPLPASATIGVLISGMQDVTGRPIAGHSGTFSTGAEPDFSVPVLIARSPASSATDVPVNVVPSATFNEQIDPAGAVTLTDSLTNAKVAGSTHVSDDFRTVFFVPDHALAVGRQYAMSVGTVADLSGNSNWNGSSPFTTAMQADSTAPQITGIAPSSTVTAPLNTIVRVFFDEPVQLASVATVTVTAPGGPVTIAKRTLLESNRTLAVFFAQPLSPTTVYTVTVSGIKDSSGNVMAGSFTSNFTTGTEMTLSTPSIVYNVPSSGMSIPTNASIVMQFNQPVGGHTDASSIRLLASSSSAQIPATASFSADGLTLTVTPSAPLQPKTGYSISMSCFYGLASNYCLSGGQYPFSTNAEADSSAPVVLAVNPPDGATGVPTSIAIRVRVDDCLAQQPTIQLTPAVSGTTSYSTTYSGSPYCGEFNFTPTLPLALSTHYDVTISGIRNLAGLVAAPVTFGFTTATTATADTTRPTVTSVTPANGTTGVSVNTPVVVNFSEPVNPFGILSGGISSRVSSGASMPLRLQQTGVTQWTITPTDAWPANETISIYFNSTIRDLSDNYLSGVTSRFTTAGVTDITPPSIVSVSPANGTAGLGRNTTVAITFSEPMDPSTMTINNLALFAGSQKLSSSIERSSDNRTVLITTTLPPSQTITVAATSDLKDFGGNRLPEFSSTFTTAAFTDSSATLQVVTQRPGTGATVPIGAPITLFLNRPVNPATVNGAIKVSQNGVLIAGSVVRSAGDQVLTFTPATAFPAGALIQVFVDRSLLDDAGSPLSGAYTSYFRIQSASSSGEVQVLATSFSGSSNTMPLNAVLEVQFNQPLDPVTVNTSNVTLTSGSATIPITVALVGGGTIVRVQPNSPLSASSYHYLALSASIRTAAGAYITGRGYGFYTGTTGDTVPGTVAASPDGVSGVGVNAAIRLEFSERVNPVSLDTTSVRLSTGGTPIPYTLTLDSGNQTVTLTPIAALPESTSITVNVNGVRDLSGNTFASLAAGFVTSSTADLVRPEPISVSPSSSATNVPVNSLVTVVFGEPIDTRSARSGGFRVHDGTTGKDVVGTLSFSSDGSTLHFAPTSAFAVSRTFSVSYNGVRDLSGNYVYVSGYSFTTSFSADSTAPQVLRMNPENGYATAPRNSALTVLFDEPVQPGTGTVTLSRAGTPVSLSAQTLANGNRRLTLVPADLLSANTTYSITISGVRDSSGNPMSGTASTTFTTSANVDLVNPLTTVYTPSSSLSPMPANPVIRVAFSERINMARLESGLRDYVTGALDSQPTLSPDGLVLTVTPLSPLQPGKDYSLTLNYADLAGNTGIQSFSFRTGSDNDLTPPAVSSVTPPAEATGVPVNPRILILLNEPLDATSVPASAVQLTPSVTGAVQLSSDRRSVTFVPSLALAAATRYTISLNGARDLAGNPLPAFSSSFTTASDSTADVTRPTILSSVPASGATGVSTSTPITVNYSEPIDPTTICYLTVKANNIAVAGSCSAPSATQAVFTPLSPFPPNAVVTVTQSSTIVDLAGNSLVISAISFTTANTVDSSPFQVTAVTPVNGAADINVDATVVIALTFNKTVDPNTLNGNMALLYGTAKVTGCYAPWRAFDNRSVTISCSGVPGSSTMTVAVTSGVRDLAGNSVQPFQSTFTTAVKSVSSSQSVLAQRPDVGASGVPAATPVTLFFSQAVDPGTVANNLHVSQDGVLAAGSIQLSDGNRILTFTPSPAFSAGALVEVFFNLPSSTYRGSFRVQDDLHATAATIVEVNPSYDTVPRNASIDVRYSKPLDPGSIGSKFTLTSGGATVSTSISLRGGNTVVRITPTALLPANASVTLAIAAGVRDVDGFALGASSYYFWTSASSDNVPGTVTAFPSNGVTLVPVNTTLRFRFSKTVKPTSIPQALLQLQASGIGAIPATLMWDSYGSLLKAVPLAPLPPNTEITVSLSGVEDSAGNLFPPVSTHFTTGAGADFSSLSYTTSLTGITDIPANPVINVTFNKAIDPASLGNVKFAGTTKVPAATSLSADFRTLTIAPTVLLDLGQSYSIVLDGISDLTGYTISCCSSYFTTGYRVDTQAPQVTATSPANGATAIPLNGAIQITFDSPLMPGFLDAITLSAGGTPVSVRARTLSNGNRTVSVFPNLLLSPNTTYTVSVTGVKDLSGNLMTAVVTYSFTSGDAVDLVAPTVVSTSPVSSATGVSRSVTPTITLSEAIDPATVEGSVGIRLTYMSTALDASLTLSADRKTITITPAAPLRASTTYQFTYTGRLADLAGNTVTVPSASFTTAAE